MRQGVAESLHEFLKTTLFVDVVEQDVLEHHAPAGQPAFDRIRYQTSDGDEVPAFLWIPDGVGPFPAVLVHHQHNSERHFGKSEVAGLVGNPWQAFAPALAAQGFVVLAPDSICFEDRRKNKTGVTADTEANDWLQHYNEMIYRISRGDTLMRKVLDDASVGISLLSHLPCVAKDRIGVLGHSYGGNTTIFQTALDHRIRFACSSGAVCSYANKFQNGTGLEMALAIPGIALEWELDRVIAAAMPRSFLIVSASDDKYSKDALDVERRVRSHCATNGVPCGIEHTQYEGGHPLSAERFDRIVSWIVRQGS